MIDPTVIIAVVYLAIGSLFAWGYLAFWWQGSTDDGAFYAALVGLAWPAVFLFLVGAALYDAYRQIVREARRRP